MNLNNIVIILDHPDESRNIGAACRAMANNDIRELLKSGLDRIMASQARTYDEMTKYGWYKINNVQNTTIKETLNKINNKN